MQELPIIYVKWRDAFDLPDWHSIESIKDSDYDANTITVGFLIKEHPDWIVVSGTVHTHKLLNPLFIPRAWIKEWFYLADDEETEEALGSEPNSVHVLDDLNWFEVDTEQREE